jgi:AraC-like DNA-binding protein
MGPLPQLLETAAGARAVDTVFRSVGLPLDLVETPDQKVPLSAMLNLFERASQKAADSLFGLRVGLAMAPASYGLWVVYSISAPTLGQALERLSQTLVLHQPGGQLMLRRALPHAVWTYIQPSTGNQPCAQHADHILPVMIAVIRAFLGPDWLPSRVQTNYADPGGISGRQDLLPVDWSFEGTGTSVRFPAALLDRPGTRSAEPGSMTVTRIDTLADAALRAASDPADALDAIVTLRLHEGQSDIDGAARLAGLSVRSLQRRLTGVGLSYSQLVDRVRERKARILLAETTMPIAEIAQSMGYSDQANFTRAFIRMVGCAPGQFRSRAGTGQAT